MGLRLIPALTFVLTFIHVLQALVERRGYSRIAATVFPVLMTKFCICFSLVMQSFSYSRIAATQLPVRTKAGRVTSVGD